MKANNCCSAFRFAFGGRNSDYYYENSVLRAALQKVY